MPKSSRLTVKPLNAWNFSKLKPHEAQIEDYEPTRALFKDGYPPHQAMFYDGRKSILACGLIDMGGGQYYIWSVFSKNIRPIHYRFIVKYLNNYISLLKTTSIHHIIRKDMPWTKHMITFIGFRYVRDESEFLEHWIRI